MITELDYAKIIAEFEFLKFFPTDKNKIIACFKAIEYSGITEKEELFKAFRLWVNDHDTFPSHIELRDMLIPKMKEYSIDEIFNGDDSVKEIVFIRNWMNSHCDIFYRPKLDSFDKAHLTIAQDAEWSKQERISDAIAMKKFKTYFKENPTEYKKLLNGDLCNNEIEMKDKSDDLGIDFSGIGKID